MSRARFVALAVALCFAFVVCCATPPSIQAQSGPTIQTPSGVPEVEINVDKKFAIETIANIYSANGWLIKTVNDYTLVVERPEPATRGVRVNGRRQTSTPNVRVSLSFSGIRSTIHIGGRVELVSRPGTAYESVTDISRTAGTLQRDLLSWKSMFEGGVIGIGFERDLVITEVVPGSPAAIAGLKRGDRIEELGGRTVTSYENARLAMPGSPGSALDIAVTRDGSVHSFTLERRSFRDVYAVLPKRSSTESSSAKEDPAPLSPPTPPSELQSSSSNPTKLGS